MHRMGITLSSDLLVVCLTRGRPEKFARMMDSLLATSRISDMRVYMDIDDPKRLSYPTYSVEYITQQRSLPARSINEIFVNDSEYKYFFGASDDLLFHTDGWDELLVGEIVKAGGWGIAYGNDLHQKSRLPTNPVVSSNIVHTLGWISLPTLEHLYGDNVLKDIGMGIGKLIYRDDVIIEHCHPHAGTGVEDEIYHNLNSPERYRVDEAAYNEWVRVGRISDIKKLRGAMG